MQTATYTGPGDVKLQNKPVPTPGPGELLLRVGANTICGTDLRIMRGEKTTGMRSGVTLGHEFAGTIEALGEGVTGYEVGQMAAVCPVISCGYCERCLNDYEHLCTNSTLFGYWEDGGLASHALIPARAVKRGNVVTVDKEMDPAVLALAEPLSCCLHGLEQYRVEPGDTVVVLGAGPIGLIHTQLAKLAGAGTVIVTNRSPERRQTALEMGADIVVNPREENLRKVIDGVTNGRGADVVVVAIGVAALATEALTLVRAGGRVNFFAGFPVGTTTEIDPNLVHYSELQITGGSNTRRREFRKAVALLESGRFDASGFITNRIPLSELERAFETVAAREGVKTAVIPD